MVVSEDQCKVRLPNTQNYTWEFFKDPKRNMFLGILRDSLSISILQPFPMRNLFLFKVSGKRGLWYVESTGALDWRNNKTLSKELDQRATFLQ